MCNWLNNAYNFLVLLCVIGVITSANNLDLDQVQQTVDPDLDPNCFETVMVFLRKFLKKKNQKTI